MNGPIASIASASPICQSAGATASGPTDRGLWPATAAPSPISESSLTTMLFLVVIALGVGSLLIRLAGRRRRSDLPTCPACRHDLRGQSEPPSRCPECGDAVDPGLVYGGRIPRVVGIRRAVAWTGRLIAVASLMTMLGLLVIHPVRLRHTPTSWLGAVDVWWAGRLDTASEWTPSLRRSIAAGVFDEIRRRGLRAELSNPTVGRMATRLLEAEAAGWNLGRSAHDLIAMGVVVEQVPPERLMNMRFFRAHPGTEDDSTFRTDPVPRLAGTGRIEISQPIAGEMRGLLAEIATDFALEIEIRSVTVGGRPVAPPAAPLRVGLPIDGVTGRVFEIVPPAGSRFDPGPAVVEWEAEFRVVTRSEGKPPTVIRREVFAQRLPTPLDLLPAPPTDDSIETRDALRADLAAHTILELDPATGAGLLMLTPLAFHELELGTPTLELILPFGNTEQRLPVTFDRFPASHPLDWEHDRAIQRPTLYGRVPAVTLDGTPAFTIGDRVVLSFDSTRFDDAAWWSRLDSEAFALGNHGHTPPTGVVPRNLWRAVRESLDRIVTTRFQIEIPVVPRSGAGGTSGR